MDIVDTKLLSHSGFNLLHKIPICEIRLARRDQEHIMQLYLEGETGTYVLGEVQEGETKTTTLLA